MKLHAVLTSSRKLLAEADSIGVLLKAAGVRDLPYAEEATAVEIDIDGVDTPELRSEVRALCRAIEQSFAKAATEDAELKLVPAGEADEGSTAPVAVNVAGAIEEKVGWSPDAQKMHDVNGSRANAALPRVLAARREPAAGRLKNFSANVTMDGVERHVAVTYDQSNRSAGRDAYRGTLISMVDALRQLVCRGASPLAIGCALNLSQRCDIGQLRKIEAAVRAVAAGSSYLALPCIAKLTLVAGPTGPENFLPVANVWAAGCFEQAQHVTSAEARTVGDRLMVFGEPSNELGSVFLAAVHELGIGDASAVQLSSEKKLQNVMLTLIRAGVISAARNISAGGLIAAVCDLLMAEGLTLGARLDLTPLGGGRADALLFGESQGRVVVAVPPERVGTVLSEAHMRGVSAALIGEVTGGSSLGLKTRSLETEWNMVELRGALAAG